MAARKRVADSPAEAADAVTLDRSTKVATTLRFPKDVHTRLRVAAAEADETLEQFVLEALRNEFARRSGAITRHVALPDQVNPLTPLLAEVFLQFLPTFCVIKKGYAIVWANLFMLEKFGRPLEALQGRTLVDAGLVEGELAIDTVRYNIAEALKRTKPEMRTETLKLKNLGITGVRTLRFLFDRDRYLGDISFIEPEIRSRLTESMSALTRMQRLPLPEPEVQRLFVPCLQDAPLAIALKTWRSDKEGSAIGWANKQFIELVHRNQGSRGIRPSAVVGQLTTTVLGVPIDHSVLRHEGEVVRSGRGSVAKDEVPGLDARWSFRFPILDLEDNVRFIGVVSPDFRLEPAERRLRASTARRSKR